VKGGTIASPSSGARVRGRGYGGGGEGVRGGETVRPRGQATDGARGLGAAWAVMHKFFLGGI
jgi:hypothetical protein